MENGDETEKRFEMAAAEQGNHTNATVDIDRGASSIDGPCKS
jgi:hypothetical protein